MLPDMSQLVCQLLESKPVYSCRQSEGDTEALNVERKALPGGVFCDGFELMSMARGETFSKALLDMNAG